MTDVIIGALGLAVLWFPARMFYQEWKNKRALARLIRNGWIKTE